MQHLICFQCSRSSNDVPLIQLTFQGRYRWVCPQCMPALIHKPETVLEALVQKD